jgi:hypothetical protein
MYVYMYVVSNYLLKKIYRLICTSVLIKYHIDLHVNQISIKCRLNKQNISNQYTCRSITESGQFDDDIDDQVQINSPKAINSIQSKPFDG